MRSHVFVVSVVVAVTTTARAFGQQADTASRSGADTTRPAVLSPVVVTATRTPIRADRVGFAVAVVDADRLALERPLTGADALRALPGSYIDEAAGPGGPTIVRLRGGEEVFTQILVDGVALNENGGFFDFQGFTPSNVDRIEVARGTQSSLYGSSAMSGVVQFLTRPGQPGAPRLELTSEGGGAIEQGGTFRSTLSIAGGGHRALYSAGIGATYYRGIYGVPNDTWTREGSLRVDIKAAARWDLAGIFRLVNMDANLPVRDPGAMRVPLDPNARNGRDRAVGSLEASFAASEHWTHRLTTGVYRQQFYFGDLRDSLPPTAFFVFNANFMLTSILWRPTLRYVGSYASRPGHVSGQGFTFSYGAQWEREDLKSFTGGEFPPARDRFARSSGAAFAEALAAIGPRLNLLVGTRVEKFEGLSAQFTPRASVVFQVAPPVLSVRGAAGRAYKAPNLQEQYLDNPFIESNPDLRPETSTSWELGTDLIVLDRRLRIDVGYFRQKYDNLIRSVTAGDGSGKQINRNLGASRAEGVEWMVQLRASRRWLIGLDGSWVHTTILDNTGLPPSEFPEGESLPFRPTVVGSGYVQLTPVHSLTAVLRATIVGTQTVLTERFSGERVDLDPYGLVGLAVNLDVARRLSFYARADNLLNTSYETAFDRRGIPLTAALGVRLTN